MNVAIEQMGLHTYGRHDPTMSQRFPISEQIALAATPLLHLVKQEKVLGFLLVHAFLRKVDFDGIHARRTAGVEFLIFHWYCV